MTIERTDNKIVWGVLEIESTGLELIYRDGVQDDQHMESSYILYGEEYASIQAIYRFVDQLTPENKQNAVTPVDPGPPIRCANEQGQTRNWRIRLAGATTATLASGSALEKGTLTGSEMDQSSPFYLNNQNQVASVTNCRTGRPASPWPASR